MHSMGPSGGLRETPPVPHVYAWDPVISPSSAEFPVSAFDHTLYIVELLELFGLEAL